MKQNLQINPMQKKILALFIAFVASVVPSFAERVQIGGLYYNLDATNQTAEVTYEYTMSASNYSSFSEVEIPALVSYEGATYSVTGIGADAFFNSQSVTSVSIANGVTGIGNSAFSHCSNLTNVSIPSTVTSMGTSVFNSCESLPMVTLPDDLTTIEQYAFYGCTGMTGLTIPANVTSIGDGAFGDCTALTQLKCEATTPPTCGSGAFLNVSTTIPVYVPSGSVAAYQAADGWSDLAITTSGRGFDDGFDSGDDGAGDEPTGDLRSDVISAEFPYAYYMEIIDSSAMTVSIEGVYMPATAVSEELVIPTILTKDTTTYYVKAIRNLSFSFQESIKSVRIESGTETIHANAFRYLTHLNNIEIPNTVISIGEGAFNYCDSLTSIYWNVPDYKAATNQYGPFYGVRDKITTLTFGENVRAIPAYFCYGMTQMGGFETSSETLSVVREHAFEGCTSMYWFPFYEGLDTIEAKAFMGCTGLSQGMSVMASLQYVGDSAFANCTDLMSVSFEGNPDIFGRGVFAGCTSVESVTVPYSWNHIPDYLCENMTALKNFTQLEDYSGETISQTPITSIGQYAFAGCSSLENAPIPDPVNVIGFRAFKDCYTISSLTIPANVTTIGAEAFGDCSGLKSITSRAATPPAANTAFTGVPATIPVIVPSGSVNAYRQAAGWSGFYQIMTANSPNGICGDNLMWMFSYEDSTLYISGSGAMYNYGGSGETGTTGSDGGGTMAAMAPWFENDLNGQIYHVSLPTGLTSIGDYAFYSCSNLQEVDVPEWVTTIGDYAFQDCAQMKSCKLHYNLTSIGAYAFNQCMILDSINLPVTLGSLGEAAFQSCESLRFVEVPEGITTIPKNAFYACKNLNQVNLPTSLLTIGEFAFNACSALPSITIPDKVTMIGDNAFEYCDNMTYVALSDSLQSIGGMAFYDCPLARVDLPAKLTNIGYGAFMNCSTITEVYCYAKTPPTIAYAVGSSTDPIAFPDIASTVPVYVPVQSLLTYKYRTGWKTHNLIAMNLSGTCGDNLTWLLDFSDSTFTITGSGAMTDYANDQGRPWVLYDDNNMPDDYSTAVKTLILPEGMTSIGKNAFRFFNKITEVTIPSTVTTIGESAFGACYLLASVTIPDNVTTIGSSVFSNNKALTSIHIGSGVTSIGTSTFNSAPLMTMTVDSRNTTYDSRDNCNAIIKTASNELAFGCKTTVIPNTVTTIASFAFSYCSGLTSITIPASVKTINGYAFSQCTNLTEITSEALTPPTLVSSSFYSVSDTIPVYVPARGYKAYKADANWNAKFSKIIALPCDTTYTSEENLTIMESQLPYMWNEMQLAEEGTFSATLRTADGCDSVVTLHLTVLPGGTCGDNLTWVYNPQDSSLTVSGTGVMTNWSNSINAPWYSYRNSISSVTIGDSVSSIGDYAFYECSGLTSIEIPNSVTSIGETAFYECSLTSIKIPNSVTSIGKAAFRHCEDLTNITIGNSVSSIGDYAFYECSGLTSVTIPNSVTSIGNFVFAYCSGMTSITIPNSVVSIGEFAFEGCSGLTSVTIPNGVMSIEKWTFYGCSGLTNITIPNSITKIGAYAFYGCSGLTSINIPNGVTNIGLYAFSGCSGLTDVTIPNSVTSIGEEAFKGCTGLNPIICEATTPPTCGTNAFLNVPIFTSTLYVPYQSVSAYKQAEEWQVFTHIQAISCDTTYRSTEEVTIAETQLPYTWHDYQLTAAGMVDDTLLTEDGCDSILTLHLTVMPVEYVWVRDTVCYDELPYEWRGQQLVVSGYYYDTVRTAVNGLDSIIYANTFMAYLPVEASTETATICEGEQYAWHGMSLTEEGQYMDTVLNADGCDSICFLQLHVNPAYHFRENAVTCQGELFEWHGRYLETAGTYFDSLRTVHGCDSIYEISLTVNPMYSVYDTAYICAGDKYEWNGQSCTDEMQYMVNLHTMNGCDSFCYLQLYHYPVYFYEESETRCEGQSFEWHGRSIKTSGIYYDSLQTVHGCDSIYKLEMTYNPTYFFPETATICQGDTYLWHDYEYTTAGIYYDSLTTLTSCDSVYELTLTVNPSYDMTEEATICQGEKYEWHGQSLTEAGRYIDTLHTVHGCDSICTLVLTVNPAFSYSEEVIIAETQLPYVWHDREVTASGDVQDTLETINGCDSIITLNLTVLPVERISVSDSACYVDLPVEWRGQQLVVSGTYYDTIRTTGTRLDSIIYTNHFTAYLPVESPTVEATICQGEKYEWHGRSLTEAGQYVDTLLNNDGCDSICYLQLHVNPSYQFQETAVTCEGEPFEWHHRYLVDAGTYYDSLQTIHGCDSIWSLTLTVNPVYHKTEDATICQGEKYEWHGQSLTEAGRFTDTLHTVNGCDSICNLVLTVNPTFDQTAEATICEGTTYSWHGKTYTTAGIYYDSLQTIHGCDSIWTLTLTVNPSYTMTEEATICQGETYTWHDVAYTEAGRYTDTLHTVNGCDSICNLVLTVNPTFDQTAEATICEGTTYSWHGKTYTTAGIYYDSLQTIRGCDSIWTLTLTVNPAYDMTEEATICQGEKYEWHGQSLTEAGRFTDTLHTVNGCDSICNLVLTVNPTFDQTEEATICEGTTYNWHGKTYTTAGIYYDSLQTINGCDSIWTLTLTVNPAYNMTEEATICQGEKYEWHGQSLTEAGRYTDTLHSVNGCDSICNLVLTVNPTFEQAAEATICEGTTYSWHGKTYTTSGIYYDSLQTIHGCDSIWTLTLTVNPSYTMTEEATICQGETYTWHDVAYTEAGRYTDTLHTINGCDSICNLVLTINPTFDQTEEATICEGTTYSWHGKTYTTAGIYYDSLQTIHGCDSIWTLTLTVNPAYDMTEEATICQGTSYRWQGSDYTTAGTYHDSLQTIHGCDSILTLVLTVNETYSSTEDVAICQGEAFEWHGQTYTTAGRYQMTLEAKNGCDSVCTLNLTVNATYTKQESAYICAGETYRWHDRDYTIAGIYYDTLLTIHGCDSICTLTLRVGSVTTMPEETMTVCAKELPIVWRGQSFTATGMYYDTVRNTNGCDSIYYSLRLIVNREITTTENAVICDGETITWHGRSLTKQGLYYDTLQTVHGCDSICVLSLKVNPSYYIEEIVSIREDKLPYIWQGQSITQAGTYYADYRTVNTDCDSIITLQLMVTELPIYTVNVEADHGVVNGTGTYPEGTHIVLMAVPDEGFEFQMWSDGSETNPKEFVVMRDTTFRAHFYMPEVEQEVTVDSIETNSVTITWDTVAGAVLYELRIYKNGELVVTYEVDPDNNIVGERHIGPDRLIARKDSTGGSSETLQVNIGGLEPGQDYTYSLDALDDDRSYVGAQSGSFTTEEEPGDGLDTLFDKQRHQGARKVLRDGQLFIELPDGTRYSPEGALLE